MTRKDYEAAATLVQYECGGRETPEGLLVSNSFALLFASDNPRFDRERFNRACLKGHNVKARTK